MFTGESLATTLLDEHTAAHIAELFRFFSDTSRVRILHAIIRKEMNTSGLAALTGLTESAVSHQLRGLRQQHLVQAHRVAKEVFYQVLDEQIIALFQQGVKHIQEKRSSY